MAWACLGRNLKIGKLPKKIHTKPLIILLGEHFLQVEVFEDIKTHTTRLEAVDCK